MKKIVFFILSFLLIISYGYSDTGRIHFFPSGYNFSIGCSQHTYTSAVLLDAYSGFHGFQAEFVNITGVTGLFSWSGAMPGISHDLLSESKTQIGGSVIGNSYDNISGINMQIASIGFRIASNFTGIYNFDLLWNSGASSSTLITKGLSKEVEMCIPGFGCQTTLQSDGSEIISTIPQGTIIFTPIINGPCNKDDANPSLYWINNPHISGTTKNLNDRNYYFVIQDSGGLITSDRGYSSDPSGLSFTGKLQIYGTGIDNESGINSGSIIFEIMIESGRNYGSIKDNGGSGPGNFDEINLIYDNNDSKLNLSGANKTRNWEYRDFFVNINYFDLPNFGTGNMIEKQVNISIYAEDFSGKNFITGLSFNQGSKPYHVNNSTCNTDIELGKWTFTGISVDIFDDWAGIDANSVKFVYSGNNLYEKYDINSGVNIIDNSTGYTNITTNISGGGEFSLANNSTGYLFIEYIDRVGNLGSGKICEYSPSNMQMPQLSMTGNRIWSESGANIGKIYFDAKSPDIGIDISSIEMKITGYVGTVGLNNRPSNKTTIILDSGYIGGLNMYLYSGGNYNYTGYFEYTGLFYVEENIDIELNISDFAGNQIKDNIKYVSNADKGIISFDNYGYYISGGKVYLTGIKFTVADSWGGIDYTTISLEVQGLVDGVNWNNVYSYSDMTLNEFLSGSNYGNIFKSEFSSGILANRYNYTGKIDINQYFDIVNNISLQMTAQKRIGSGVDMLTEYIIIQLNDNNPIITVNSEHSDGTSQGLSISGGVIIDLFEFDLKDDRGIGTGTTLTIIGYIDGVMDTTLLTGNDLNLNNYFDNGHTNNFTGEYLSNKIYDAGSDIILILYTEDNNGNSSTKTITLSIPESTPNINILSDHNLGGDNGWIKSPNGASLTPISFQVFDVIGINKNDIKLTVRGTMTGTNVEFIFTGDKLNLTSFLYNSHNNNYSGTINIHDYISNYFDSEQSIEIEVEGGNYSNNINSVVKNIYGFHTDPVSEITSVHKNGGENGYTNTSSGMFLDLIKFDVYDDWAIDSGSIKLTIQGYVSGINTIFEYDNSDFILNNYEYNNQLFNYTGLFLHTGYFDLGSFVTINLYSNDFSATSNTGIDTTIVGEIPEKPNIEILSEHKNGGDIGWFKTKSGAKLKNIEFYLYDKYFVNTGTAKITIKGYKSGILNTFDFTGNNLNLSNSGLGNYTGILDFDTNSVFSGYFDHEKNIDIYINVKNQAGIDADEYHVQINGSFSGPDINLLSNHNLGGGNGLIKTSSGTKIENIIFDINDDRAIKKKSLYISITGIQNGSTTNYVFSGDDISIQELNIDKFLATGVINQYFDPETSINFEIYVEDFANNFDKINFDLGLTGIKPEIIVDSQHNLEGDIGWYKTNSGAKLKPIIFSIYDDWAVDTGTIILTLSGTIGGINKEIILSGNDFVYNAITGGLGGNTHNNNYEIIFYHTGINSFNDYFDPETDIEIEFYGEDISGVGTDIVLKKLYSNNIGPTIKIQGVHSMGNELSNYEIGDMGWIKSTEGYLVLPFEFEVNDDRAGINIDSIKLTISGSILSGTNIINKTDIYSGSDFYGLNRMNLNNFDITGVDLINEQNFTGILIFSGNKSLYTGYYAPGYPISINLYVEDNVGNSNHSQRVLDYQINPFMNYNNFDIGTINYGNPVFEVLERYMDGDTSQIDTGSITLNIKGKQWGKNIDINLTGIYLPYGMGNISGYLDHNLFFDYYFECNKGVCNYENEYDGEYEINISAKDIYGKDVLYNGNNVMNIVGNTEKIQCNYLHRCNSFLYFLTGGENVLRGNYGNNITGYYKGTGNYAFVGNNVLIVGTGISIDKDKHEVMCNTGGLTQAINIYTKSGYHYNSGNIFDYNEMIVVGGEINLSGDKLIIDKGK